MESVSIDVLRGEDYINFLKAVYSVRPHISMYSLRMNLAVKFSQTTDNDTMFRFACSAKRPGLGKRLRSKTESGAAGLAAVLHISRYLDKLYEAI